jgi:hypothetical protein
MKLVFLQVFINQVIHGTGDFDFRNYICISDCSRLAVGQHSKSKISMNIPDNLAITKEDYLMLAYTVNNAYYIAYYTRYNGRHKLSF